MKREEAFQIQRGDYFLYHGETVKVTGRSPYNESNYTIENKNGSKFYAEVEELQPITINVYTLKQAGFSVTECLYDDYACYYRGVYVEYKDNAVILISGLWSDIGEISECKIHDFHILQNALRLFGVEVELRQ